MVRYSICDLHTPRGHGPWTGAGGRRGQATVPTRSLGFRTAVMLGGGFKGWFALPRNWSLLHVFRDIKCLIHGGKINSLKGWGSLQAAHLTPGRATSSQGCSQRTLPPDRHRDPQTQSKATLVAPPPRKAQSPETTEQPPESLSAAPIRGPGSRRPVCQPRPSRCAHVSLNMASFW